MSGQRWPRWVYGVGEEPDPRFSLANERTFLAWIRTGLGFLAAGVALVALGAPSEQTRLATHLLALGLIACGLFAGLAAYPRWMRAERAMRRQQPLPTSIFMPILVGGLGIASLIAIVVVWP